MHRGCRCCAYRCRHQGEWERAVSWKKIVEVPTSLVVKSPRKLIEKLEEMLDGRTKGV